jgi:hypothetical protein
MSNEELLRRYNIIVVRSPRGVALVVIVFLCVVGAILYNTHNKKDIVYTEVPNPAWIKCFPDRWTEVTVPVHHAFNVDAGMQQMRVESTVNKITEQKTLRLRSGESGSIRVKVTFFKE